MRTFGIKVPRGAVAATPEEAAKIAADIGNWNISLNYFLFLLLLCPI